MILLATIITGDLLGDIQHMNILELCNEYKALQTEITSLRESYQKKAKELEKIGHELGLNNILATDKSKLLYKALNGSIFELPSGKYLYAYIEEDSIVIKELSKT